MDFNRIDQLLISFFLHSSDSGEKLGVQCDNASAIYALQESLYRRELLYSILSKFGIPV